MKAKKSVLSVIGIVFGSIALLLALFHFYAGPFSPQKAIENAVAEKAIAIRDATIAALKGKKQENKTVNNEMNLDKFISIATALLAGIAIVLGVVGFATKEPARVAFGATVLGVGAIAFQFLTLALSVLIFIILVAVILNSIGFDL